MGVRTISSTVVLKTLALNLPVLPPVDPYTITILQLDVTAASELTLSMFLTVSVRCALRVTSMQLAPKDKNPSLTSCLHRWNALGCYNCLQTIVTPVVKNNALP